MVESERSQIIWRMRVECWISKATRAQVHIPSTHACTYPCARAHTQKYVILITFPRQQWLRERASVLRLYVHCVVAICFWFLSYTVARVLFTSHILAVCCGNNYHHQAGIPFICLSTWRDLFGKLTGSQLVKKFPVFYGSRRFITAFTRSHHLFLF